MTTNPRSTTTARASGRALKLYVTTALALVYVGAWLGFAVLGDGRSPADAQTSTPTPRPLDAGARGPGRVVWYRDLAASERPAIDLPPGWQVAETTPATQLAARDVPAVRRVAPTRPRRVRTRSS